ncbi:glycoside hydrolase family 3 C-terminal domain-containing protein [Hymenobacter lapidiphilus]|uniref:Glycoside hydrolase family 3 C-terminal domain-containing protein n=1 Tax=Hymenobacter lapidiphilus TaxID=2608003 RepID=A0A7Y7PM88_9BACT|nr:glycoside hydrolase family 3 C-terminal domain-containing protein [Hymenobacter lapidiphilus]NVO30408.1 glycoside hydrolase family 3 C-terminal domain-containing protein [Hymenobacter lapidiphilus]
MYLSRYCPALLVGLFCAACQGNTTNTTPGTETAAVAADSSAAPANRQQHLLGHETQVDSLLRLLTLEEKLALIHANSSFTSGGVPRLSIPELKMSDGPHGVRVEFGRDWEVDKDANDAGTYLPSGNALASTWNPELGYAFGRTLGREANARGKDVILGPGINIIRTPLNGRNFEYLSEDPYLVAQMAVGYIRGVQDQGISACVKHFAANNQEEHRNDIDVNMSERALREIYLPGFRAAVEQGGVNTLMGSYNKFRGTFATHNAYLMNDVLKGEWGFKGVVISDWGSVHDTQQGLRNGTDLEMGTDLNLMYNSVDQSKNLLTPDQKVNLYDRFFFGTAALQAIRKDSSLVPLVDDKVRRLLRIRYATGMMPGQRRPVGAYNAPEHHATARKVAEEGIVLLKNEGQLLPLNKAAVKSVAVVGANATRLNSMGGGSSQVKAKFETTALQGLQKAFGPDVKVTFSPGYTVARGQKSDPKLMAQAVAAAKAADVTIFVGGSIHGYDYKVWSDNAYDAEAYDKPDMRMPFGQDELVKALLQAQPNTVVVLLGGGPIDVSEWVGQARSVVEAWYPGMEGGTALAGVLLGTVNPSGKLPFTFPVKLEDAPAHKLGEYPSTPGNPLKQTYKDDIYVGYRYFDTYKVAPQFAFGHGLSYTSFEYGPLAAKTTGQQATVTLTVRNTGKVAGAEVVQLYVHDDKTRVKRPEKELKAFRKVFLQPGESKTVTLTLGPDAFRYYDEAQKQWTLEPGRFTLLAGSSSRDIRQQGAVEVQ